MYHPDPVCVPGFCNRCLCFLSVFPLVSQVKGVLCMCLISAVMLSCTQQNRSISEFKHLPRVSCFHRELLVLVSSLTEPRNHAPAPRPLSPLFLRRTDTLLSVPGLTEIDGFLFQLPTAITVFIHTAVRICPLELESISALMEICSLSGLCT